MSDIDDFIKASNLKHEELFASIFRNLMTEYPDETDRQHVIRAAIMMFEDQYKPEMRRHERSMKHVKETRANEYASNDIIDMRIAFRFPDSMITRINMILINLKQPSFLSDDAIKIYDEGKWLRKNFPRYCVPELY